LKIIVVLSDKYMLKPEQTITVRDTQTDRRTERES